MYATADIIDPHEDVAQVCQLQFRDVGGRVRYTRLKTITSRWPTGIRTGADFVMPTMR